MLHQRRHMFKSSEIIFNIHIPKPTSTVSCISIIMSNSTTGPEPFIKTFPGHSTWPSLGYFQETKAAQRFSRLDCVHHCTVHSAHSPGWIHKWTFVYPFMNYGYVASFKNIGYLLKKVNLFAKLYFSLISAKFRYKKFCEIT